MISHTGVFRRASPRSTRCKTSTALNAFEMEKMGNTLSSRIGLRRAAVGETGRVLEDDLAANADDRDSAVIELALHVSFDRLA